MLEGYEDETTLVRLATRMRDLNMPVPPRVIEAWADRAHVGISLHRMAPARLSLRPVKQRTKESRCITLDNSGMLGHWYDPVANLGKDSPARLVYNFDKCGF